MQVKSRKLKIAIVLVCATGFSVSLGGCSGFDGVDINLPVVGNIMAKTKRTESRIAERGKLLLPPKAALGALPAPGSGQTALNSQAWPDDPDLRAKRMAQLKKAKADKERREGNFKNYSGQEGFDRATDSFERQEGVLNKYYNKGKAQ